MNEIILRFSDISVTKYKISKSAFGETGISTDIKYNCSDVIYTFQDTNFVSKNETYTTEIGTFRFENGDITYSYTYSGKVFSNGSVNIFQIISGTKDYLNIKGEIKYIIKNNGNYKVIITFK